MNSIETTTLWKPAQPAFQDREEAGKMLGRKLFEIYGNELQNAVVLGCVRGGLVVAAAVVNELKNHAINTELDILISRRIGDPNNREFTIGFITEEGSPCFLKDILEQKNIDSNHPDLLKQIASEIEEIKRRIAVYRGDRVPVSLEHKKVIIIDDGMASGGTTIAAIQGVIKSSKATAEIIVGQPVASNRAIQRAKDSTKVENFCIVKISEVPKGRYWDIEDYYKNFSDVADETVIQIMAASKQQTSLSTHLTIVDTNNLNLNRKEQLRSRLLSSTIDHMGESF